MPSVIAQFAEAARKKDAALNADLLADDVRLYGVRWSPFEGRETALAVLAMLLDIIEGLEYVAEYEGPDGVVLQVRGSVGGREFDGTQVLRFDASGLIIEIRDLMRPHSAGAALLEASAEYLSQQAGQPPDA